MSTLKVENPIAPPATPQDPPRKRRKRAAAAGAAADCFTCSSRGAKCDRRRPYCSQCLEEGKDCSGYKTQLTWGVGVASRGKLRGLSLPVAGTKRVAGPTSPPGSKKRQSPTITHDGSHSDRYKLPPISLSPPETLRTHAAPQLNHQTTYAITTSPVQLSQWNHTRTGSTSITTPNGNTTALNPVQLPSPFVRTYEPGQDQPLIPSQLGTADRGDPDSLQHPSPFERQNADSYSRTMQSPSAPVPPVTANYPSFPHYVPFDSAYTCQNSYQVFPHADESYVRHEIYQQTTQTDYEASSDLVRASQSLQPLPDHDSDNEEVQRAAFIDECAIADDNSVFSATMSLDFCLPLTQFSSALGIGKTPRMQYLINYYAEVISPVIVAFDGPNNPYRTQILRLASDSETLQHAISALAASNLRQRRDAGTLSTGKTDPARRSSMAHLTLTDEAWHNGGLLSPTEQAREETYHKNYAVQSLNQQLADPALRKNDSILAILLILCLFHICDSGVAKFQTQFAGVKKLLSLRGQDLSFNSPETKWFTRMFTWFDTMTAAVNDREGQLQGQHLDISALSDEEWSLENLAGCDGKLFKTIGKLGRLNVLSQGKKVECNPTLVSKPFPPMPFTDGDDAQFDGNGWTRMMDDEGLFSAKTTEPDLYTQFWREWREVRQTLQTWQLDSTIFDSSTFDAPRLTSDQLLDLSNISESFRYSALLYTERLANPAVPSTDQEIQNWVKHGLKYIKLVKSDVYLLWPLFITGSECVEEVDRSVIRERCLDIQKDSGFLNNKSCLELLEKVWARDVDGIKQEGEARKGVNGFRFRGVMESEGSEGEYIVV